MTQQNNINGINFTQEAIYKIVILGTFNRHLAEELWGLQVSSITDTGKKVITTLIGIVNDQSKLNGILTTFYEMHLTIISVTLAVYQPNFFLFPFGL